VLALAQPLEALAEQGAGSETAISVLDAAKLAINAGDLAAARDILNIALSRDPGSIEARFLLGELESRAGNFKAAIEHYRAILVDHPELVRVRLDLARALFELGDDEVASYHFQLALAAPDLPPEVITNVHRFLAEIHRRKRYAATIDIGIAPDSNESAAPNANDVTVFGLPFQLTQASQPHSGVGLSSTGSAEVFAPLTPDLRWRAGSSFYSIDYPAGQFDDSQIRLMTGPQLLDGRSQVSLLAVAAKRWYGNDPYSYGSGGRLEAGGPVTDRLRLDGYVEGLSVWYHAENFLNGFSIYGVLFSTYGLSSDSFIRLITGGGTDRTQSPFFSDHSVRLGAAYQQDFPFGITSYVEPDVVVYQYDATSDAFGKRRHDVLSTMRLAVHKRDFTLFGFSPVVSYTYFHDASDINLFSYVRNLFELGVTRDF
jgi:tetratricopeptide (TPR) repeat protein